MGNSAVIVPRGTGHQPALRIRQMNIPFHRHRKIRGKRFRIIPEHIRQTFPQVNRVAPRINAPENTILRPEHAHGSEKMLLSSAGPPRVNRVSSKSKEKRYRSRSGFGSARTGRKHINSISIRHLPSLRRGFPHTRRVQPAGCHPLPALPKGCVPPQALPKESFPEWVPPQELLPDAAQDFPAFRGGRR